MSNFKLSHFAVRALGVNEKFIILTIEPGCDAVKFDKGIFKITQHGFHRKRPGLLHAQSLRQARLLGKAGTGQPAIGRLFVRTQCRRLQRFQGFSPATPTFQLTAQGFQLRAQ